MCSAYESFVNLDTFSGPLNRWPEPGVEIMWESPPEPECKASVDCGDLADSECLVDPSGQRRCLCKSGFQWDPINAICHSMCLFCLYFALIRVMPPIMGNPVLVLKSG